MAAPVPVPAPETPPTPALADWQMVEPAATVQDSQSTEPVSSQEPATSQLVFPVSQTETTPSPM
eukprot:4576922-Lingulodinium_polyedra.AAC.1